MPEGDSLVRLAHRLRPVMKDEILVRSDFRIAALATVDLSGWKITELLPTAKYLSMFIQAPQDSLAPHQTLVIFSHLGIDGSWQIDVRPTHQTRCILGLPKHNVVGFSLSTLEVFTPQQAQQQLTRLGPDLLDPDWYNPQLADQLLSTARENFRQRSDQPIGSALLDQRIVSGIGNIYRCEVLSLARMNPYRRVGALTDGQLGALILLVRELMVFNVPPRSAAHTARSTVDIRPDAQAAFGLRVTSPQEQARAQADSRRTQRRRPRFWVYNRQTCLRCGTVIRRDPLGAVPGQARYVYWCPYCQAD